MPSPIKWRHVDEAFVPKASMNLNHPAFAAGLSAVRGPHAMIKGAAAGGAGRLLEALWWLIVSAVTASWAVAAEPSARPAGASGSASATKRLIAPDIETIQQRGELVVALNRSDNPPYVEVRNGELTGRDVEMMMELARQLKVAVRFDREAATFDAAVDRVAAGEADVAVGKLARTMPRAQRVAFSDTYARIDHALLINRLAFAQMAMGNPTRQVIRSFTGTIAVIQGSAWEEFGRVNFPAARIVTKKTWDEAVKAALSGEVVAAYRDDMEVRSVLQRSPALAVTMRLVSFEDAQSHLAVAVGRENVAFRGYINEFISARNQRMPLAAGASSAAK